MNFCISRWPCEARKPLMVLPSYTRAQPYLLDLETLATFQDHGPHQLEATFG